MSWSFTFKINRKTMWCLSFDLVVIGMINFFYLINSEINLWNISISNIFYLYTFAWSFLVLLVLRKLPYEFVVFDIFVYVIFVLCIISSIIGNINFGNDVLYLFLKQKFFWISCLVYFALKKLLQSSVITKKQLVSHMKMIGLIYIVIIILQYVYYKRYEEVFLYVYRNITGERFYYATMIYIILGLMAYEQIIKGNIKFKYIILIALTFFILLKIERFRNNTLALCMAMLTGLILFRNKKLWKISLFGLLIPIIYFFVQLPTVQNIIYAVFSWRNDKTASFRMYWNLWCITEIVNLKNCLGLGYVDQSNSYAVYRAIGNIGSQYSHLGFKIGDHGIFGFLYIYGIQGALWFICMEIYLLVKSYQLHRIKNTYWLFLYVLLIGFQCFNEIHWYDAIGGVYLITISLIIHDYVKE